MNILEEFILLLGFSWQMSNLLPFILLFLSSVFVVIFLRKKSKKTTFNFLIRFLVSFIPLSLYFGFNPVFESDIYDLSKTIKVEGGASKKNNELVVFSLPNCPYCLETISLIALLKKRNPDLTVTYKIITHNDGGDIESILKKSQIKFELLNKNKYTESLTQGSYPTFVYNDGDKELKIWDNNSFGTKALDFIEDKQR